MVDEEQWNGASVDRRIKYLDEISDSGRMYYKHYPANSKWEDLQPDLQYELFQVATDYRLGPLSLHKIGRVAVDIFAGLVAVSVFGLAAKVLFNAHHLIGRWP